LRAFVIKSDHPRYQLRLKSGVTVSTSMQEELLMPRLATWPGNPNDLAPDQDDPFVDIRRKVEREEARGKRKLGSYGVHGHVQQESICLVEEAYAKAVKLDDAPVPEHLWNDRVKALGIAKETRDKALVGFQNLGLRWFKSALKRDCADFRARAHGVNWTSKHRKGRNGDLTELGQDQHAIANLVCHSTHTNWFEFNAGS
jgi:hypothetical protein